MATNVVSRLFHAARRAVAKTYLAGRLVQGHYERRANEAHREAVAGHKAASQAYKSAMRVHQQQAKMHKQSVKARVAGVRAAGKQVTKGSRTQRAQQLRQLRANPAQRQQLRRRVKFKTQMP